MSRIFNRRNAVLGWIAWKLGKRKVTGRVRPSVPTSLAVLGLASIGALAVGAMVLTGRRERRIAVEAG